MQVDYLNHLPDEFRASAAQLYFSALKEKLEPVLGSDGRAQEAIASNLATDKCLVAIRDDALAGIMGIQTDKGGFVNPRLKTMIRIYGIIGAILRISGLAMLHHTTGTDELYVDGVAVAQEMRGKGIGSQLFGLLERTASEKGIRTISLEVIDTNIRVKTLYERLGFQVLKKRKLWPLNLLIKFPFGSATLMVKNMG